MIKRQFIYVVCCLLLMSCQPTYHTVQVTKPRLHKSWYKNHVYHKKIGIGRIRIKLFEKQGTKLVKMKG